MRIQSSTPESSPDQDPPQGLDIDIYRSSVDRTKLLSVPAGTNPLDLSYPSDLDKDLYQVLPYKSKVHLERDQPALGLDVKDIFAQIAAKGYAAHQLKVSSSIDMGIQFGRSKS
jgi:hypothetical protein